MSFRDPTLQFNLKDWKQEYRERVRDIEKRKSQRKDMDQNVCEGLSVQGAKKLGDYWLVDVDKIESGVQIRKFEDKKKISLLMHSIKKRINKENGTIDSSKGLINPITVSFFADSSKFVLINGSNRLRADKKLNLEKIPCKVNILKSEPDPVEVIIEQYRENKDRDDLKAFEEAFATKMLVDGGMTQRAVAKELGKSPTVISKLIRIAKLIESLPEELRSVATLQSLRYSQWESLLRIQDPWLIEKFIKEPTKIKDMRTYEKSRKAVKRLSQSPEAKDRSKMVFHTQTPISVNTRIGIAKIKLRIDFSDKYTHQDIIEALQNFLKEIE